jgi:hypothetical protein
MHRVELLRLSSLLLRLREGRFYIFCLLIGLSGTVALKADDEDLAEYLISGVMSERESWVTGVARVSGTTSRFTNSGWEESQYDVTISFDNSISSVRYDIRAGGPTTVGGVYIKTPDKQVECLNESGSVAIIKGVDESPSGFVIAPDLHSLGLLPVRDFLNGGCGARDSLAGIVWV